jgi:MoxR-like ATPase
MPIKELPCGCQVEDMYTIPKAEHLTALSRKQLCAYANTHNVGPTGRSGTGFSQWRNKASAQELTSALNAHRDKAYNDSLQGGASLDNIPPELLAQGNVHKIGPLFDAMEKVLETVNPEFIAEHINAAAQKELAKYANIVQTINITLADGYQSTLESQHKDFKTLLRMMAARVNVMLVGPAGSGKTEGAMAAAKALNLPFELISVGPQTMQSELAGYKNAVGEYVASAIYRAFTQGKVLILDEMDAGNAGVFTFLNSTLSNMFAGYPTGVEARHENFFVIACANTFGSGADMVYIGRNQLDGATLDRYAPLVWDYDHDFELKLALQHNPQCESWVKRVWHYRKNMMDNKIRHIISPRASIFGAKLLLQGFNESELEKMLIFKGLNKENADKIRGKQTTGGA